MEYSFFKLTQPVGNFYVIKINAADLIPISESNQRKPYNNLSGVQRNLNSSRINSIARYSQQKDAMFPTPIILSAKSIYVDFSFENSVLSIKEDIIHNNMDYFSIVDGQHRLAGLERAGTAENFDLLALLTFDTTLEEDARIFISINKNQKPVTKSLVYDLFGLSSTRSVEKFLHEIALNINQDDDSRMKNHIKMLGYKTDDLLAPNITQGALVDIMSPLFTNNTNADNIELDKGFSLDENNKIPLRSMLINNDSKSASDIIILFLNAWMDMVDLLQYGQTKFVKAVGYNLAFRMLKKYLNENPNYLQTDFEPTVNDFILFNKIKRGLQDYQIQKKPNDEIKDLIQSISKGNEINLRVLNDESQFNLLAWILYQLKSSEDFDKDSVDNFASSLSGVDSMFKLITGLGKK